MVINMIYDLNIYISSHRPKSEANVLGSHLLAPFCIVIIKAEMRKLLNRTCEILEEHAKQAASAHSGKSLSRFRMRFFKTVPACN